MNSFLSRVRTAMLPARIALKLGGAIGKRCRVFTQLFLFLCGIALGKRRPVTIRLVFQGKHFSVTLQNSADLAAVREVFLDEEYSHERRADVKTVFDVGANIGMASIYFACLYPQADIYAFEPDPDVYARLEQNVSVFERIHPFMSALSDSDGQRVFYAHPSSPLAGSLLSRAQGQREIPVSVRSISSMIREIGVPKVDILKFDIEGGEYMLFANKEDLSCVTYLLGEAHLDLMAKSKEEFLNLFTGFEAAFTRQTAKDRYLFHGESLNAV